jgi:hypothetical protein
VASCAFCGCDSTLTKEHVFPEWVRPYLQGDGDGTHRRTEIRKTGATSRSRPAKPATLTVRSVCAACNNGWMSRLEGSAKRHLLPLIKGRESTLLPPARQTIATWAVKTALVAGSKFDPLPTAFYREFYEAGRPADKTRVWLAHAPHLEAHTMDWRSMRTHRDDEAPPKHHNSFQAVLSVGHLVAYVVGWQDRKPELRRTFDRFDAALAKVWPSDRLRVHWPPSTTITLAGLDDLANTLGTEPAQTAD